MSDILSQEPNSIKTSKTVFYWLALSAIMVIIMVFIGGLTRLTNSGLSIVEWKPITGIIPPYNLETWQIEFAKYQTSPEFQQINQHMTLEEFKFIYLLEFIHRMLGRLTGLIFIVPLIYFFLTKSLNSSLQRNAFLILFIGMLQGIIGWYMVKSGLYHEPHVSHFRLAMHLITAAVIFGLLIWQIGSIYSQSHGRQLIISDQNNHLIKLGVVTLILCYFQIWLGGLVAGLDAGLLYNQFPLMGNRLIPEELINYSSIKELLNDPAIVQFWHRISAYVLAIITIIYSFKLKQHNLLRMSLLLQLLIVLQLVVGVVTLLTQVQITLALLHQIIGFLLLGAIIFSLSRSCYTLK